MNVWFSTAGIKNNKDRKKYFRSVDQYDITPYPRIEQNNQQDQNQYTQHHRNNKNIFTSSESSHCIPINSSHSSNQIIDKVDKGYKKYHLTSFHRQDFASSISGLSKSLAQSVGPSYQSSINRKQKKVQTRKLTQGTRKSKYNAQQYVISIIQNKSRQIGFACYNTNSGQIVVSQIIDQPSYLICLSLVNRYLPIQMLFSKTQQETLLVKKLNQTFKQSGVKLLNRNFYDQTKGFYIYNQTKKGEQQIHPDTKYVAWASLNALVSYLQSNYQLTLKYSSLNIKYQLLQKIMVIDYQSIRDLEIFLNTIQGNKDKTVVSMFESRTIGGMRMLRANLMQPLVDIRQIEQRYDLIEELLKNNYCYELLFSELEKFKHFQNIVVRFIQKRNPDFKFFRGVIHNILLLAKFVRTTQIFKQKLNLMNLQSPLIKDLIEKVNNPKISQIGRIIKSNLQQSIMQHMDNLSLSSFTKIKDKMFFLIKNQQNQYLELARLTYSKTLEVIQNLFQQKRQKKHNLKLKYNQNRGYHFTHPRICPQQLSAQLAEDVIQVVHKGKHISFTTSSLISLNNRMAQSTRQIIFQSQKKINEILDQIDNVLYPIFQFVGSLNMVDMILSFTRFARQNRTTRPVFRKYRQIYLENLHCTHLEFKNVYPVALIQKESQDDITITLLRNIGISIILAQSGCFVPATKCQLGIFGMLRSKFKVKDDIQWGISHFQAQLLALNSIFQSISSTDLNVLTIMDQIIKGTSIQQQRAFSKAFLSLLGKSKGMVIAAVNQPVYFPHIRVFQKTHKFQTLIILMQKHNFSSQLIQKTIHLHSILQPNHPTKPLPQYIIQKTWLQHYY